jgi:hypothetical protein
MTCCGVPTQCAGALIRRPTSLASAKARCRACSDSSHKPVHAGALDLVEEFLYYLLLKAVPDFMPDGESEHPIITRVSPLVTYSRPPAAAFACGSCRTANSRG